MSENVASENVEVVRKAIWAFENDADVFKSMQSSEGVWFPFEDNHSPSYGIEGAMRIRSQWLDAWDEYRSEIEDVVAEGENVVVDGADTRETEPTRLATRAETRLVYQSASGTVTDLNRRHPE